MITLNALSKYPKAYVYEIKDKILLSDEESEVYDLTMRHMSAQQIADSIMASTRTVYRRKQSINDKLITLQYWLSNKNPSDIDF